MRKMAGAALAAALLTMSAAAGAQNTTDPGRTIPPGEKNNPTQTTPPQTTPPATTTPPVTTEPLEPEPVRPSTGTPVIVTTPAPAAPPIEPIRIDPTEPYPNGFADPNAPFGNDMSVSLRQQDEGFDWGLLGLLGLFGLAGLWRRRDHSQQVFHSERVDDGRTYTRR